MYWLSSDKKFYKTDRNLLEQSLGTVTLLGLVTFTFCVMGYCLAGFKPFIIEVVDVWV